MAMTSLINLFYGATAIDSETQGSSPRTALETGRALDSLRTTMQQDFQRFIWWLAATYDALPKAHHVPVFQKLQALQHQVDQAYRAGDWVVFQAALVTARVLFSLTGADQDVSKPTDAHWIFRAWSRVLDAEVWFVCCEQEVVPLTHRGIPRGAIYTEAELTELLRLPRPDGVALKDLHLVKTYFDATVVPRIRGRW